MKRLIFPTILTLKRPKAYRLIVFLLLAVFFSPRAMAQDIDGLYSGGYSLGGSNMNNPFGVLEFLQWDHSWNNYKYPSNTELETAAGLMKEAGVGWVRMDFAWSDIEPVAGDFNFAKYDNIVEILSRNNISILGILDYSTDWASSCGQWNCPPADNQTFVDYAVKVASRYKGRVKYWEIWNEPDSRTYWTEQDGLKGYCVLLKDVYLALKQVDPGCKVLNGGLANGISSVNKLYDNGAGKYFDILNLHLFESPFNEGAIKRMLSYPKLAYKIMSRNGDAHKKIWITEIGCPGLKQGLYTPNWWLGQNPDEEQQAEWVGQVFTQLIYEVSVERVFWAFFRDCDNHWGSGVDYFGLVRWDFSKKPAFFTYKECAKK